MFTVNAKYQLGRKKKTASKAFGAIPNTNLIFVLFIASFSVISLENLLITGRNPQKKLAPLFPHLMRLKPIDPKNAIN